MPDEDVIERNLCVTLERQVVTSDGSVKVFRCVERSEHDDRTQFFGSNINGVSVVEVARDNIRSVVYADSWSPEDRTGSDM